MKIVLLLFIGIVAIVSIVIIYMRFAPQFGKKPDKDRLKALAKNSNFSNGKFANETETSIILPNSFFRLIREQFKRNPGRTPDHLLPSVKPVLSKRTDSSDVSIIWLGHSSMIISVDNTIILTDPAFGKRASPISFAGPSPFQLSSSWQIEDLPFPDIIILSHDHFDHLDYKTIKNYYSNVNLFLVPLGIRDHLERWGIDQNRIMEFDWWQSAKLSDSLSIIATPARHFSGRRGQDNSTLWCSWVIQTDAFKIFFSGDSGYGPHFKNIGNKYGPFDLTMIECGAYGQYWPYIHMTPEQTAQAHLDLKGKILLPIHWAKFNLALHPWSEPICRLKIAADKAKINFITPLLGEEISLGKNYSENLWWQFIK